MNNKTILSAPHKNFEGIKKIDENGVEYWEARELLPLLGYKKWEKAEDVIARAARACINSSQDVDNHFHQTGKMVQIGSDTVRRIKDYKLDRYACYLIAQNGDSKKTEIALAQTYFAVQTRKQEIFEQLPDTSKRLFVRGQVCDHNKKLFRTAKQAGVTQFGLFNDAGYRGLYGMPLSEIEREKGIKKRELLDRAGSTELAANLFRITQTDEKLKKDKIQGDSSASQTHFMVGEKVRKTIKEIGGTMPENLPTEKQIKEIKKEVKQAGSTPLVNIFLSSTNLKQRSLKKMP
ncbi:DNA damage-inducible protein D [Patescibacteria group bacterium]|nr:DNA damage-inducible protein D [Patescibacteria group bacterium]MBU1160344.1 DNA damage-inducible protein D [Patescibacteria group bacterium]MBU1350130.1 DNA damage-inducible protein D [Patescibacteria group bacterium]MBU1421032.1 DNA damage-inducible protein D [Patescibacteria group bacterium]MBU1684593.1 DNA damage-inducible protein D [Patescibacteria group bacterium]